MNKTKINKSLVAGMATLATLAIIAGGVIAVNAASNDREMPLRALSQEDRDAHREAAEAAIAAGDFAAWQEVAQNSPWADQINADNFAKFAEAHNLKGQGRAIMEELGIERGMGMNKGARHANGQGMRGVNCPNAASLN